jgi:hypothetical protein
VLGANPLRVVPGSRVAVVPEPELPYYVHAFAALTDAPTTTPLTTNDLASVWQVTLDSVLQPLPAGAAPRQVSDLGRADYVVGQLGPIAWRMGNDIHVAWIGAGRTTIHVDSTGVIGDRTLGDGATPVAAISPLGDLSSNPGVIWLSAGDPPQAFGEIVGPLPPSLLQGCPNARGAFVLAHSSMLRTGLWVASWTRLEVDVNNNPVSVTSELQLVGCAEVVGCSVAAPATGLDCSEQPRDGTYDGVSAILAPANEPNIIYEAVLASQYADAEQADAILQVVSADFSTDPPRTRTMVEGLGEVVSSATGDPPLWSNAVAFSGTDRVAVAWVEPGPDGTSAQAHFERYRICPLTDDDLALAEPNPGP